MQSKLKVLMLSGLVGAMALVGCSDDPKGESVIDISVDSYQVVVSDADVGGYDFASLFTVTVDGVQVALDDTHIDASAVSETAGTYYVVCTYGDKTETVEIIVVSVSRSLNFAKGAESGTVTLTVSAVDGFDFKSLFVAKENGSSVPITDAMVESNVTAAAGEYKYTVSYGGTSKTLTVTVVEDVLIVPSYRTAEITESEFENFDFTRLFSLYVEGKAVRVTSSMLDTSELENAEIGKTYNVSITYMHGEKPYTSTVSVKLVSDVSYAVRSFNAVTYPHSGAIDVTSLFEIKQGDRTVPVTAGMITGEIDYTTDGANDRVSVVTLHFNGREYTATVTVKSGVVIGYKTSDTIKITKGTDKALYPFSADFVVTINGVRFLAVPESYIDGLDAVDFDTVGKYEVTLKLPYSDKPPTLSGGAVFETVEKKLTYEVTEHNSVIRVIQPDVVLKRGTTEYNLTNNILLNINGKNQAFTTNKEWVDKLTCYVERLSAPIDFKSAATQEVRLAIYDSGVDKAPTIVSYTVTVDSGISVVGNDAGVFAGATVYTTDLFAITDNGAAVEPTPDMISGKVDTFVPGTYEITATYKGKTATAVVTVFDVSMKGVYKTLLTTIPPIVNDDDDNSDGSWSDGEWNEGSYYSSNVSTSRAASGVTRLGNLVVKDDGSITVNGTAAEIVGGENEGAMRVMIGTNLYTMYVSDGIVVLVPDNELFMPYTDYRRPLIYFNSEVWAIEDRVEINYSTDHVLNLTYSGYSIDAFRIRSLKTNEKMWYGLKVDLVEKVINDVHYRISWGEVEFADDFVQRADAVSSCVFDGETYRFTMSSANVAKTIRTDKTTSKFVGKSFVGKIGSESARLTVSSGNSFALTVNNKQVFSCTSNDINNNKNAYIDENNDEVFLYKCDKDSDPYSYKFKLDVGKNTFVYVARDMYYGKYETDKMFVFLDGYGTGVINFDKTMFTYTRLRYTVQSGVVHVTYVDPSPSFKYGDSAEFYMGEFLNTLTAKKFDGNVIKLGEEFVNGTVTDGARVEISTDSFPADNDTEGKKRLLNAIKIVTKDGELTGADKDAAVDTSTVSFNQAGYYRYAINLTVGSEQVKAYYTLQIMAKDSALTEFAGTYGKGLLTANSFTLEDCGRAVIVASGVKYEGIANKTDNGFVAKVFADDGRYLIADGKLAASGIVEVRVVGSASYTDYYTSGTSRVCGNENTAFREITVGGVKTYVLSAAATATGEVMTATIVSGNGDAGTVFKLESANGATVKYVKVIKWSDIKEGLQLLDPSDFE